jgi:hypothetical protein
MAAERAGNFGEARRLALEAFDSASTLRDRIHYRERAAELARLLEGTAAPAVGRAVFPVVSAQRAEGLIRTVSVRDAAEARGGEETSHRFMRIRSAMEQFLRAHSPALGHVVVLRWGLERLSASLDIRRSARPVRGDSGDLATALACVSFLLDRPVPSRFAFTGGLRVEGDRVLVTPVSSLEEKAVTVARERPSVRMLVVPSGSSPAVIRSPLRAAPCGTLDEAVRLVFGDVTVPLRRAVVSGRAARHWLLLEAGAHGNHVLSYQKAEPADKSLEPRVLPLRLPELPARTNILVLDGPMPSWLLAHLSVHYANRFEGALAASTGPAGAAAVVVHKRGVLPAGVDVGDRIDRRKWSKGRR